MDANRKSYDWKGAFVGSTEMGVGLFLTHPQLVKTEKLKDGRIALMYVLKATSKKGYLVLGYRAAVGLIYDPVTEKYAETATFLVDDEDYYQLDPQYGYYSTHGDKNPNRPFSELRHEAIRLTLERSSR